MCFLSWVPAPDCFWSSLERAHSLWWGGSGPLLTCPPCSRSPSPRSALVPALCVSSPGAGEEAKDQEQALFGSICTEGPGQQH